MKTRKQKAIALLIAICLLPLIFFSFSIFRAEYIALTYLKVLDIYDTKTFYENKDILYEITHDKIFKDHQYSGTVYPRIQYQVRDIKCSRVRGFRSFDFKVTLVINKTAVIDCCIIKVDRGLVTEAHRED